MSDFPYIKSLKINDCYASKDLEVDAKAEEGKFKHIILTGKNGSGKTTILNSLFAYLDARQKKMDVDFEIRAFDKDLRAKKIVENRRERIDYFKLLRNITPAFGGAKHYQEYPTIYPDYIFSIFRDDRKLPYFPAEEDKTPLPESFFSKGSREGVDLKTVFFKYLLNRKFRHALASVNGKDPEIANINSFFNRLDKLFQRIFDDPTVKLRFSDESFYFILERAKNKQDPYHRENLIPFEYLPSGYSSILAIIADLMIRIDLFRREKKDYSLEPEGFILIDEPETHLHLKLQYQILPIINEFFPGFQIIAATHSPAVISSLKDSVVYDLSSQKTISDWPVGSSFAELMLRHFGLENEYGPVADKIIDDVKEAVAKGDREKLNHIFTENEKYLEGNTLQLQIENELIRMEAKTGK